MSKVCILRCKHPSLQKYIDKKMICETERQTTDSNNKICEKYAF